MVLIFLCLGLRNHLYMWSSSSKLMLTFSQGVDPKDILPHVTEVGALRMSGNAFSVNSIMAVVAPFLVAINKDPKGFFKKFNGPLLSLVLYFLQWRTHAQMKPPKK